MEFAKANVADLLRSNQRDEQFVKEMQDKVSSILKMFGGRFHHGQMKIVPMITNAWYYFMTTMGNLQTLGEEYTGIVRVNSKMKIPSHFVELIWLCMYIGGEPLVDKMLFALHNYILQQKPSQTKTVALNILQYIQSNKDNFKRLHQALFFMNGRYYNIANRITNITYVLVRRWMQDDTFTKSFRLVGKLSLFYLLALMTQQTMTKNNGSVGESNTTSLESSKKICVLCGEGRKNPCATPCGHIFCWTCLFKSLNYQQTCPICRERVTPNRVISLQNHL